MEVLLAVGACLLILVAAKPGHLPGLNNSRIVFSHHQTGALQFGKKLQAAMIRKLQESDVTTQWSLNYKLNSKLRMQFNITSAPPFPKTLMFYWSSLGQES
jgi:hypothetical protein